MVFFSSTHSKPGMASILPRATATITASQADLKAMASGIQAWFDASGVVTPVNSELATLKRRAKKTRKTAHVN